MHLVNGAIMSKKTKSIQTEHFKNIPITLTKEELTQAIVDAHFRIQKQENHVKKEQREQLHNKWLDNIGYKQSDDKFKQFINILLFVYKIVFQTKKYYNKDSTEEVESVVLMLLKGTFSIFKIALYLMCVYMVWVAITSHSVISLASQCICAFGFLLLAKVFKIAEMQIDNIKDPVMLSNLLGGMCSFLAMSVSAAAFIIAVIRG